MRELTFQDRAAVAADCIYSDAAKALPASLRPYLKSVAEIMAMIEANPADPQWAELLKEA